MPPEIRTLNTGELSYKDPKGFFVSLSSTERAMVSRLSESFETQITQKYPEGYRSPQLERAINLNANRAFERQTDLVSCVYFSTANAFRILDKVDSSLSVSGIKNALRNKNGEEPPIIGDLFDIKDLTEVDPKFSQLKFQFVETPSHEDGFEKLLEDLGTGKVALWSTHFSPNLLYGTHVNFEHLRLIAGFKIELGKVNFQIIDPYDARVTDWSLAEVISASMYTIIKSGESIDQNRVNWYLSFLTRIGKKTPLITTIQG